MPAMDEKQNKRAEAMAAVEGKADAPRKVLSEAAKRALAEAEARRAEIDRKQKEAAKEIDGRGGLDPVRYGDWEIAGKTSDF